MTTLEILKKMRALLDKPENWTRRTYARDVNGEPVSMVNPKDAVSFCIMGAYRKVSSPVIGQAPIWSGRAVAHYKALQEQIPKPFFSISDFNHDPHRTLSAFNDDPSTTHTDMLSLLDRAIISNGQEK